MTNDEMERVMQIKSKRAKEKLNTLLKKQEQGFFFFREDVTCEAIALAEQDTEQRAVEAFEETLNFINMTSAHLDHNMTMEEIKIAFAIRLLNGGQSG